MFNFADTIRSYRKQRGLTQVELAQRAEIGLATLQNIEANKANPSLNTLEAILKILGVEIQICDQPFHWEALIQLGCPLVGEVSALNYRPTKSDLISLINVLSPNSFKFDSREAAALTSFLSAIEDHYPGVWKQLRPDVQKWQFKNKKKFARNKLRRISLERLGRYL